MSEETSKVSTLVNWAEGQEEDFQELHQAIRDGTAQVQKTHDQDISSDEDEENDQEPEEKGPKLLWAAQKNAQDLILDILKSDANLIKFQDADGYTALHRAAYSGSHESLVLLLKNGADISALTSDGWTPLHSACRWNRTRCVETLLAWGADVNASTIGGQTALHLAAVTPDSRPTLETLLLHPKLEAMSKNCQEDTPLDIAMRNSNPTDLFLLALPCFSSTSAERQSN